MKIHFKARALAAGVACAVLAVPVVAASAASATSRPPVVTVTVTSSSVTFSGPVKAGVTEFKVLSGGKGQHQLQLVGNIKPGYSFFQAVKDVNAGFGGDAKAIARVDKNITLYGGAGPTSAGPGDFMVGLKAGTYYALDSGSGHAFKKFVVTGSGPTVLPKAAPTVTAFTYGFGTPAVLPHQGWIRFRDVSDQPHMFVLEQVKPGTTAAQVQKFVKSMGKTGGGFFLRGGAGDGAGVISPVPGAAINWHYNLPAGKYLAACFWPDDTTGMPHFFMGMWKLVTLK
jgi:hypothetical protein